MVSELGGAACHSGPADARRCPATAAASRPSSCARRARTDGEFWTPRDVGASRSRTRTTRAGGTVWPLDELREIVAAARELGLRVHLDGARLHERRGRVRRRRPPRSRGLFDTVTLCLSKGLGCPLGALIAGSHELMRRARVEKHRFGGAMRQAGIVAAAGLYALDHNVERLADDHARARRLAEGWAERGLPVDLELVETNFVQVDVARARASTSDEALERVRAAGRRRSRTTKPGVLRAVTHLDVTDEDVEHALRAVPRRSERVSASDADSSTGCSQERQADRLPSVAAAVVPQGRAALVERRRRAPTTTDGRAATPDTQYRIGSITKTFTATAVMQLRDAGELDLDDRLEQHLDGDRERLADDPPHARAPLGAAARGGGDVRDGRVADRGAADRVDERGRARARRRAQATTTRTSRSRCSGRSSRARAARRTRSTSTSGSSARSASAARRGRRRRRRRRATSSTSTRARSGRSRRPTWPAPRRPGSSGRRSRTSRRWAAFLARGAEGVLDPKTIEEMWFPQVMYYPDDWVLGWGLGLMLYNQRRHDLRRPRRRDGRATSPASTSTARRRLGAAALTNSGTRGDMDLFAIALARRRRELWPEAIEPWRPEQEPPAGRARAPRPLVVGGQRVRLLVGGRRAAREVRGRAPPGKGETSSSATATAGAPPRGRERGERLRVDGDQMIWAGYAFTRAQEPFKA